MKRKEKWKRTLAWMLTAAMAAGGSYGAAGAEDVVSVQETEMFAVETEETSAATEALAAELETTAEGLAETEAPITETEMIEETWTVETELPALETEMVSETQTAETEAPVLETEIASETHEAEKEAVLDADMNIVSETEILLDNTDDEEWIIGDSVIDTEPFDEEGILPCAESVREVESIEITNLKDSYWIYDDLYDLEAIVTYAETGEQETLSDWEYVSWETVYDEYDEETEIEVTGYLCSYTEREDRVDLTLWDGAKQIDMPRSGDQIDPGVYTLKAAIGKKEYFSGQVAFVSAIDSEELTLNESCQKEADVDGYAYFAFRPSENGLYNLAISTPESVHEINIKSYEFQDKTTDYMSYYSDSWDFQGSDGSITDILYAGKSYVYRIRVGVPSASVQVKLSVAEPSAVLEAGSQSVSGLNGYGRWFRFTPQSDAVYEIAVSANNGEETHRGIYLYRDDFTYQYVSYVSGLADLIEGKTYYLHVMADDNAEEHIITLTLKEKIQQLELNQEISTSGEGRFTFMPSETASYRFRLIGLGNVWSDVQIRDEGLVSFPIDRNKTDGDLTLDCLLFAQQRCHMSIELNKDIAYRVLVTKNPTIKSLKLSTGEEKVYVPFEDRIDVVRSLRRLIEVIDSNGETWNQECMSSYGYSDYSVLYETDADGNPDYDKQVESDDEGQYTSLTPGTYALVVKAGYYDRTDKVNWPFVPLSEVEPLIVKVIILEERHSHVFETVTEKEADCSTPGNTVNRCKTCGYKDPSSVKTIPATGEHTGGQATCVKKAVCTVCGQEYGALAGHTGGKATCVKKAVCAVCGQEYGALAGHTGGKATCEKGAVCTACGKEYTAAAGHSYGAWQKTSDATVFKKAVQTRTCSICGEKETQETGSKVSAFIKLNASSLKLKTKQKTTKLTVTMGAGDSVASVKSSNTKVLKASVKKNKITLTAQKKTGKANLTVKLASGKSKTIKVTVQSKSVATTKIKGVSKKLTLRKKQKTTLKPTLEPITSQDKIKYTSSNKKVATVSSKGVITAKGKGKATITIKAGKKSFKCTVTVK